MERNIVETIDKARIISQFNYENENEPLAEDFFNYNDLGVPLAIALTNNLCQLTPQGIVIIDETYDNVCDEMEVPNDIEYSDINDMHDKWRELNDNGFVKDDDD